MSSRRLESDIWSDSARDLVAGWNPEADEARSSVLRRLPPEPPPRQEAPRPRPLERDDLTPEDSFPVGPTVLYRAVAPGVPMRPGSLAGSQSGEFCVTRRRVPALRARIGRPSIEGALPADKEDAAASGSLPRIGEELGGFRLVLELGRGAFARVFLAEELSLGHRLVALKVSRAEGDEPMILARLQHAHIVPVHSVHVDPVTGFRLLCMPFFGGTNLAQLLRQAWGLAQVQATGRSLMQALDQFSQRLPAFVDPRLVAQPGEVLAGPGRDRGRFRGMGVLAG